MENNIDNREFLEKLIAVVPSERQLKWQNLGYYNFIHFGMNTLKGKEWGDGKASPNDFYLPRIDTDAWIGAAKESGSAGVIFTAKHHDGFCLFPSKYTDYTIAASPYENGKGDLVKQVAESCAKAGLKFGIYLSPWDRHEPSYGTDAYNDFFVNQLSELLTNYGEIFEVWLDGACGEGPNGKRMVYDFDRYIATVRALQPNAVVAVCGTDVRWIGNEDGKTREQEWSVVSARLPLAQQRRDVKSSEEEPPEAVLSARDLGSRKALKEEENFVWYPAECDLPIVAGHWFWHPFDQFKVLSPDKLLKIYRNTVGNNAALLLNLSPNRKGVIHPAQVKALAAFGAKVKQLFAAPVFTSEPRLGTTEQGDFCYEFTAPLETVVRVKLGEDLTKSQRVEKFTIEAMLADKYQTVYQGATIGANKIAEISPIAAGKWRIVIKKCRINPYLKEIKLYANAKK